MLVFPTIETLLIFLAVKGLNPVNMFYPILHVHPSPPSPPLVPTLVK